MNLYTKYLYNYASTGFSFDKALTEALEQVIATKGHHIKVLDFGCGLKPFGVLFNKVDEYVGIDVYPGEKVDVVYDGEIIPFIDEYFDLVFSSSVLEHVQDLNNSLHEIQRVLSKGGMMISVVPFINHVHGTPYDYHRPTRFGWGNYLKEAGFSFVDIIAVDNRFQCLLNLSTSAINNSIYASLRKIRNTFHVASHGKAKLSAGGASPETGRKKMKVLYQIMKVNPINFILGLCFLILGLLSKSDSEGEITSGYLIKGSKDSELKRISPATSATVGTSATTTHNRRVAESKEATAAMAMIYKKQG